jgi:hypothetical protein
MKFEDVTGRWGSFRKIGDKKISVLTKCAHSIRWISIWRFSGSSRVLIHGWYSSRFRRVAVNQSGVGSRHVPRVN